MLISKFSEREPFLHNGRKTRGTDIMNKTSEIGETIPDREREF